MSHKALDAVRTAKPVDAFEAAKWLEKHDSRVPAGRLMDIANGQAMRNVEPNRRDLHCRVH